MENGRDEKGRFVKGNPGGPGRPKREIEQQYFDVTIAAISPDDWQAIVVIAAVQALEGSHEARRFLADYLMGKPLQRQELTGADGGPLTWKQVVERAMQGDNGGSSDDSNTE